MQYYLLALKNYVVFEGRSNRTEYWMFFLIDFIIALTLNILAFISPGDSGFINFLPTLYLLFIFLPDCSASARRLHDTNKSAWYMLTIFVPIIGIFVLLYLLSKPTVDIDNNY